MSLGGAGQLNPFMGRSPAALFLSLSHNREKFPKSPSGKFVSTHDADLLEDNHAFEMKNNSGSLFVTGCCLDGALISSVIL